MSEEQNPIRLRPAAPGTGKKTGKGEYETANRVNISRYYSDKQMNEAGEFEPANPAHSNMSEKAAEVVAEAVRSFHPTTEKPYRNIGLSTGGGSRGMYDKLIDMCNEKGLDFSHINFFNLDEYVGIPPDDPHSYHAEMNKNFFSRIPADKRPHSINIPDGMRAVHDPDGACSSYEKKIDDAGGIYLQVLGIGSNGHLAFSEPNADMGMDKGTSIFDLTEKTRRDNMQYFDNDLDKVPKKAISMGLGRIMKAENIILLANGPEEGKGRGKVDALVKSGYGPITPSIPASILQKHPKTTYFLTEESAEALGMRWSNFWEDQEKTRPVEALLSRS